MLKTQLFTIEQAITRAKKATKQGKYSEALKLYNDILHHQPQHPFAKKALRKLQKTIPHDVLIQDQYANPPQHQVNILINQCNSRQFIKAEQACRELLKIYPQSLIVLNVLGGALTEQGKFLEAIQTCDEMTRLHPGRAQAYYNRGVALERLRLYEDAIKSFKKAIQLQPDYAQAHSDLSLILLMLGNFKDGWKEHEWRMIAEKAKNQVPASIPKWNGESLEDKVILVRAEQGIGDEIMFSSCFPDLISMSPNQIIVECDSRLISLFSRSFPEMNIQGKRDEKNLDWLKEFGNIDYQVALGSLPLFFRADLSCFPDRESFLKPDPVLLEKWKNRFAELGKEIKIGVSWRGGSREGMKLSRTIELLLWKEIMQFDAHFVNLQYGDCTDDIDQFNMETGIHIHDWDDANPLVDLDNFVAQISALDLVISIDNSTVHFAGAVGVPVWMLTPSAPDWRWMLKQNRSPWYSSIKLFRQNTNENWSEVFSNVKTELNRYF